MTAQTRRLALLVSGGGSNMEAIVRACDDGGVLAGIASPAVVVSNRDGIGALERARRLNIEAHVVPQAAFASREEHEAAVLDVLREARADVVVLAGYMRILTRGFLSAVGAPVVNIHPVPAFVYQGAHGYEYAFAHRERLRSCFPTVHSVDAGVDTGDVILYGLPYLIADVEGLDALRARGLAEEHAVYPLALRRFFGGDEGIASEPRLRFTEVVRAWLAARRSGLLIDLAFDGVPIPPG